MTNIAIQQMNVGALGVNCYIVSNTDTKEAVVVDPGGHANAIADNLKNSGLTLAGILLTHAHFDHADGAEDLQQLTGAKIYALNEEQKSLENPRYNMSNMMGMGISYKADIYLVDGQKLELAGLTFEVIHTPGHTEGGCCYYLKDQKLLLSGDTLFCTSIGRTDFPGGSYGTLLRSIKEKLFVLPDDVKVLPGHEGTTYIGYEKDHNPFL